MTHTTEPKSGWCEVCQATTLWEIDTDEEGNDFFYCVDCENAIPEDDQPFFADEIDYNDYTDNL